MNRIKRLKKVQTTIFGEELKTSSVQSLMIARKTVKLYELQKQLQIIMINIKYGNKLIKISKISINKPLG